MIVTIFKDIGETKNPHYAPITSILKRIKDGASKALCVRIKKTKNKTQRDKIKGGLPSVCFSGKFSERLDNCLIEHSGFIVLDIDAIKEDQINDVRQILYASDFTYAGFISPSGLGIKILIKMPAIAKKQYAIFRSLELHFNKLLKDFISTKKNEKIVKGQKKKIDVKQGDYLRLHIDPSGKNVSRVCYESYDPDLFYNEDSKIWTQELSKKKIVEEAGDETQIIQNLQKWIDTNDSYYEGNRNNFIFKFSSALCRYGVAESSTKQYLHGNYPDYPESELDTAIKSAYKGNTFGIEKFTKKTYKTQQQNNEIEVPDKNVSQFWDISARNGKVTIDTRQLIKFIEANGYYIFEPLESPEEWFFIHINNMIVRKVGIRKIKSMVLEYVAKHAPENVYNELQIRSRYFEKTFLNALSTADINQVRDTKNESFIFFDGFYYKITKDDVTKMDYIDLKGQHIWEKQICTETITEFDKDYLELDFVQFLFQCMDQDKKRFLSLCQSFGYSMHTYKRMSLAKAPYFVDKNINETIGMQKGGSGKSLSMKLLEHVRNVVTIDGKDYDPKSAFKLQRVIEDTQIVVVEDFESDLKDFFVKITDGFSIERKRRDQIYIPFSESPKILANANHTQAGISDSYLRRMHVVEFGNHFNAKHEPFMEYKREFFNDYKASDWNKVFSFAFECIKIYLKDGLPKSHNLDLKHKGLLKNTSRAFTEYWFRKNHRDLSKIHNSREIVDDFNEDSDIEKVMTPQTFIRHCKYMCDIYGWEYFDTGIGRRREMQFKGFDLKLNEKINDLPDTEVQKDDKF